LPVTTISARLHARPTIRMSYPPSARPTSGSEVLDLGSGREMGEEMIEHDTEAKSVAINLV
jgi:hypothetical protein